MNKRNLQIKALSLFLLVFSIAANQLLGSEKVVFSEVLYDSAVYREAYGEWIEIYNPQSTAIDISGWTIEDNTAPFKFPAGIVIGPKSYLVITDDTTYFFNLYGCTPPIKRDALKLSNTGDYLILKNKNGSIIDQVAWGTGGSYISGWGSSTQPKASEGKSIKRINPDTDSNRYTDWSSNKTPSPICGGNGTLPEAQIQLSTSRMTFYSVIGKPVTSKTFSITNSGSGTLNWSISETESWLTCTPGSGTGPATLTVSVDNSGLSEGTYTSSIFVSDPNAVNSPQTLTVILYVNSGGSPPFGSFDTPIDNSIVRGSVAVTGWALDETGVESVKIYRTDNSDLIYIGDAVFVEGARPDVQAAFPDYPNNHKAGWGYMLLSNFLPGKGNGTFTLEAWARDTTGNDTLLGSKTINCDNAHAVRPFGAIDTPTQGGTATGSTYINWGWVLTPQPNKIPTDGSTIKVWVDGKHIGQPTYNIYRSDIATLFPEYANSDGAIGYFALDTTQYADGVHTIQWTAQDDAGNSQGIGSRYFTIQNTGSDINNSETATKIDLPTIGNSSLSPIKIRKGHQDDVKEETLIPYENGIFTITIEETESIKLDLGDRFTGSMGYTIQGDQLKRLPIGSTLDRSSGIFYWQPGPGFLGTYRLQFVSLGTKSSTKKEINITILPRHYKTGE